MALTKRQSEILEFIAGFLRERGYSPTLEEIARHFGMASLNGVHKHLRVLEERGFIGRLANRARSIRLLEGENQRTATLPLLGTVAAGRPIEAVHAPEEVAVPDSFLTRANNFVLRVQGDSMIDEHIEEGDLIIVEQRSTAEIGEMVVALIDGQEVTLKRFYRENGRIRLQPANPRVRPLRLEEERVAIQGVVVGLMRRYRR